jgi:phosphoserine phosphatase
VTGPIAKRLGVEHLIATQPEQDANGNYTGQVLGVPCFQEGKITRLEAWLKDHDDSLDGSWFYSDSRNDLPLLERVTHPIAVDADPILASIADERGWQQLSLRD